MSFLLQYILSLWNGPKGGVSSCIPNPFGLFSLKNVLCGLRDPGNKCQRTNILALIQMYETGKLGPLTRGHITHVCDGRTLDKPLSAENLPPRPRLSQDLDSLALMVALKVITSLTLLQTTLGVTSRLHPLWIWWTCSITHWYMLETWIRGLLAHSDSHNSRRKHHTLACWGCHYHSWPALPGQRDALWNYLYFATAPGNGTPCFKEKEWVSRCRFRVVGKRFRERTDTDWIGYSGRLQVSLYTDRQDVTRRASGLAPRYCTSLADPNPYPTGVDRPCIVLG